MLAEVRKCAESNDIKGLRYIFVDCLDVDPTFEKYREDYEFCKTIDGLFDSHQTLSGIKEQKETWTTEYWEQLKLDLMKNFSQIRFEHMVSVAKVVYADKISRLLNERSSVQPTRVIVDPPKSTVGGITPAAQNEPELKIKQESTVVSVSTAPKALSKAEKQEQMIEAIKKKLEEENRRIAAEQAAQQKRREAARRESASSQRTSSAGGNGLKKALGIVLAIIVVVVVVLLIKALQ